MYTELLRRIAKTLDSILVELQNLNKKLFQGDITTT